MIGGQNPNLPVRYGASFKSNTALAANTPETIISPASNVNGVIVWDASFMSQNSGSTSYGAILAKSSAPANNSDGDCIVGPDYVMAASTTYGTRGNTRRPIFIPPGKGLYRISNLAEGAGNCQALYTIL